MVSTRGLRYKFSEGERVLCYEPDPTKAKVLYDSKVLEVIENKDKRGRRTVEYLIHFQGWNSSWDRCVSEDFVLKDTEENRQLQKDLAEKSQLQLGAYLYRRERKKGGSAAKRARHGFSDDSSSSTQPDGAFSNSNEEGEPGDTDSSSGSSSQPLSPPDVHSGPANITLPSALRDRLTFDYHLVVKRGRLLQLPATPCAAEVLESFVKWFARAGAWHPAPARPPAPPRPRLDPAPRPDLLDVSCRLNLVREVADGLRVYFDFILRSHLLYKQEAAQFYDVCGRFIDDDPEDEEEDLKSEPDDGGQSQDETLAAVEEDLKSPKIPEYAHLPPDPTVVHDTHNEHETIVKLEPQEHPQDVDSDPHSNHSIKSEQNSKHSERHNQVENMNSNGAKGRETRATRSVALARRLRSHKSGVSQSENEEPAPSTSGPDQRAFETMSSSVGSSGGSSLSSGWSKSAAAAAPPSRTPLSQLLDKVTKWQIIPREGTEHLPCRVYGAIHLARLFVKLPEFLNATQMPDYKLKLVLKHVEMFVQYLEEHSEWFGEMYYIADNGSRSH